MSAELGDACTSVLSGSGGRAGSSAGDAEAGESAGECRLVTRSTTSTDTTSATTSPTTRTHVRDISDASACPPTRSSSLLLTRIAPAAVPIEPWRSSNANAMAHGVRWRGVTVRPVRAPRHIARPGAASRPELVRLDAIREDLAVERLGVDLEERGGLAAVAADLPQRADDVLPLDRLQAAAGGPRGARRRGGARHLGRQVAGLDLVASCQDHRPLDRVEQL